MMRLNEALSSVANYDFRGGFEALSQHLDVKWVLEALYASGTATIRRRRLPAELVIWVVIGMALFRRTRISEVVNKLSLALPAADGKPVAASAIVQARARLGEEPLQNLFEITAIHWAKTEIDDDRFHGLALYGVDGTTLSVYDSDENRDHFGGQSSGPRGPSGYPLLRCVACFGLRSRLIVDAQFGPYRHGEVTYAKTLWDRIPDDALVILDRGFLSAQILIPLASDGNNRHWMTRTKSSTKYEVIRKLGRGDALVRMNVSSPARKADPGLPQFWVARLIAYQHGKHKRQHLLTSLLDPKKFPTGELIRLYHLRWEVEIGFSEIKTGMLEQRPTLRSQSPGMIAQELWGVLIAYNMVRLEMARTAKVLGVAPARLSFTLSLQTICYTLHACASTESYGTIPSKIEDGRINLSRNILPERRSRTYPRAVKVKMSSYAKKRPSDDVMFLN